jgi:phosphatidylserine/phosphatidylglycerophosphate/cardiolipin synthase-like enzyme
MRPWPLVHFLRLALAAFLAAALSSCEVAADTAWLASTEPTPSPAPSWYHLYFTGPTPDHLEGGIPDAIAASLDAAQKTIDVAIYELDLPVIADALARAKARGVQVRLVTDTDSLETPFIQDLRRAKIPVVDDQRGALMHDKFMVIDRATVWTGSMNFTENDAYRNNNNYLQISSVELAENYTQEFEKMFVWREFGPKRTAQTPHPRLTVNGTEIENYFAPGGGAAEHILDILRSARTSIDFMAYSFTRADFARALMEKAQAGVQVQGVFEKRQIQAGGDSVWNALTGAGLEVRLDGNRYNMHSKVFVVDQQIVVTGSYNFTQSAEQQNDETVLIIHSADIARAYWAEWQKVWMTASR